MYYYTKQIDYDKLNKACTLPSVTKSDLQELWINIPPINLQQEFVDFVKEINEIEQELDTNIANLEVLFINIINQYIPKEG